MGHLPHSAGRGGPGVSREEMNLCLPVLKDHSSCLSSAGKMSSHPPCADLPYSSKERHQKKPKAKQSRTSFKHKASPGSLIRMSKIQNERWRTEDANDHLPHEPHQDQKCLNFIIIMTLQISVFQGCRVLLKPLSALLIIFSSIHSQRTSVLLCCAAVTAVAVQGCRSRHMYRQ